MKYQALFSLKGKSKKLKCRLLQFLFGSLRANKSCCSVSPRHGVSINIGVDAYMLELNSLVQMTK